jgi:nucleotide-binding universal stress UspA family protein
MTETGQLFRTILVATDGSDMNQAALAEAFRIGRACGSVVYAVYVADTSTLETGPADMMVGEAWEILPLEGERALARVRKEAADLNLETALLYGKPAEEIGRYAREKGVDLIVIGSQGKQGIARLLLGSVAEQVIRTAGCKVLVVK